MFSESKGAEVGNFLTSLHSAKQLFVDLYPEKLNNEGKPLFKFSVAWFDAFRSRHNISLRRITNKAQEVPSTKIDSIRSFHHFIREQAVKGNSIGSLGKWKLSSIANMDQTPIEFDMCAKGATYESRGAKTVWVKSSGSGLDKRQATVQLTVFVDGIRRVQPLIVFRGKGLRISQKERSSWDHRVTVRFQDNAWVDENVMKFWVHHMWKPWVSLDDSPNLLVADVHRAQKTNTILDMLKECNTTTALVPPGCTSLIQPLDVALNAQFKQVLLCFIFLFCIIVCLSILLFFSTSKTFVLSILPEMLTSTWKASCLQVIGVC